MILAPNPLRVLFYLVVKLSSVFELAVQSISYVFLSPNFWTLQFFKSFH